MMQHAITQGEIFRLIVGLLFVLLFILLLSWLVKKLNKMHLGMSTGFQPISSMVLGPKERITLLKVGTRYLLLGFGSGNVTLLCDFGEQLPSGFVSMNKPSFAELLKSVIVKS